MNRIFLGVLLFMAMLVASCQSERTIERSRILIDSRYDGRESEAVKSFMAPYVTEVDKVMSPVVGTIEVDADVYQPESPLSNLLADILVWAGKEYKEKPDLGVYNMGGIRASLSKGDVTYGDILEVAPFDNKICFLTLTGDKLMLLLDQMGQKGGQGISSSVRVVYSLKGRLLKATINGKQIDKNAKYRIATIDYLAEGNDGMKAFEAKTNYYAPKGSENDCREVIARYFREMKKTGTTVAPTIEGRVAVE